MEGYISLHRKIKYNWLWEELPFDKRSAFIDLLFRASHKDTRFFFNGKMQEVKRGSFITSILKLSENWGWSRTKINNFLELLKSEGMIEYKSTTKNTTITIINYDFYQNPEQQKNNKRTTKKQQKDTINNENNILFNKLNKITDEQNFSKDFIPVFITWFEYKKARKESYKNDTSILTFCKKLIKMSGNSAEIAQKIIEQSMANNWSGIFELKNAQKTEANKPKDNIEELLRLERG